MTPSVLIAVITGGRPALKDRATAGLLPGLAAAGFDHIEWVIREDHAAAYERDAFPLNVYPTSWDDAYSRDHWAHPQAVWAPGGFHGAFTGREWAMRTGEDRGFDMVLQIDDNVTHIGLIASMRPTSRHVVSPADVLILLRDVAWATNISMCGLQLESVSPGGTGDRAFIRPGFPYSVFYEKAGHGRMPWFGPFEDDIMHALEYGLHGGPHRTVALLPAFRYHKEPASTSGMRQHYDPSRGLELVRRYPGNASLRVSRRTSSPQDKTRGVRHFLRPRGFTSVQVRDPALFQSAHDQAVEWVTRYEAELLIWNRAKIRRRAGLDEHV